MLEEVESFSAWNCIWNGFWTDVMATQLTEFLETNDSIFSHKLSEHTNISFQKNVVPAKYYSMNFLKRYNWINLVVSNTCQFISNIGATNPQLSTVQLIIIPCTDSTRCLGWHNKNVRLIAWGCISNEECLHPIQRQIPLQQKNEIIFGKCKKGLRRLLWLLKGWPICGDDWPSWEVDSGRLQLLWWHTVSKLSLGVALTPD